MPEKDHLVKIAIRKYGPRPDERPQGCDRLFASLKEFVYPQAEWLSDENPYYPRHLKKHFLEAHHIRPSFNT